MEKRKKNIWNIEQPHKSLIKSKLYPVTNAVQQGNIQRK